MEQGPALPVAPTLIIEHESSDLLGELGPLPLTLEATSLVTQVCSSRRACRPDGVGRRPEFVSCHVGHRRGLTGSMRRLACGPAEVSRGGVGVASGIACLGHGDLASNPRPGLLDGPAGALVSRPNLLEEMQHVLSAIGRPKCEQVVVGVSQGPASTQGDEPGVSNLTEDHCRWPPGQA